MSESEALQNLLQRHRRSSGLNDFHPYTAWLWNSNLCLKAKGRAKQQAGGQNKGSSILTEAARLDVRKEIARIAGVSVGNVTKVKQLTTTAHSDIIKALREKELSIHRAWLWSKLSPRRAAGKLWLISEQRRYSQDHTASAFTSSAEERTHMHSTVGDLIKLVSALQSGKLGSVRVVPINVPGKIVFVTEELFRSLDAQEELALTCATNNP